MKYTIIGIGEILWDIFKPSKIVPDGEQKLGGAPANFAYHASELGHNGIIVSSIGNDELGNEIIKQLKPSLTEYITKDEIYPTGKVDVDTSIKNQSTCFIHENVAWDFIPNTASIMALAEQADVVCFGSLAQRSKVSQLTIEAFLKKMSFQSLRIFDVNLRQNFYIRKNFYNRNIINSSLQQANVFKVNDQELPIVANLLGENFSGKDEQTTIKDLANAYDLKLVALTKGENGSVLYADEQFSIHPGCCSYSIVDIVGAGDAFTAALAVGWLKGYDLDRINENANCVANFVCSEVGATPKLLDALKKLFA